MMSVERVTPAWVKERFAIDKPIEESRYVWAIRDGDEIIVVAGVVQPSLLGWAELWIVLTGSWRKVVRARRALMDEVRARFPKVSAHTRPGRDARFAEFCGFARAGTRDWEGETLVRFEL